MGPYFRCNRLSESDKRGLAGGVAREICNWDGAARDGAERTVDFLQRLSNGRCIRYVGSKGPRPASRLLDRAGRFFDFRSGTCENRRRPAMSELVGVALELIGILGLGSALRSMDSHLPLYRGDKLF